MRRHNKDTFRGKKLALSKESLKQLTPQQLALAGGAGPTAIDCSVTCW
ncbi:MAG TPA: hypothetical protein VH877_15660 [Polyangia bacterium]|jgi:hypothetical protein|nr:hypothetical protein [Polyangia bacterium]